MGVLEEGKDREEMIWWYCNFKKNKSTCLKQKNLLLKIQHSLVAENRESKL